MFVQLDNTVSHRLTSKLNFITAVFRSLEVCLLLGLSSRTPFGTQYEQDFNQDKQVINLKH